MKLPKITGRFLSVFVFVVCFCTVVFAKPGDNITIDLGDGVKMHFVYISRGKFVSGNSRERQDRVKNGLELQQIQLTKNFIIGKFEVTQAQYQKIMGRNPSYFVPGMTNSGAGYLDTSNHPVEQVSWYDAIRFCNALSMQQDLTPCYTNSENGLEIKNGEKILVNWDARGFRLPTDAEWTYCSRAGTTTDFPWGDDESEVTVKQNCWYAKNADHYEWTGPHAEKAGSQPVGTRLPNPWGLHDMFGNVNEWCWNPVQTSCPSPHEKAYNINLKMHKEKILIDPKGLDTEDYCYRTCKGGCYSDSYEWMRFHSDAFYHPDEAMMLIGFRVVAIR